jgi:beta-galactosidase
MHKQSFNQEWRFHLGHPEGSRWVDPDDSNWRLVDLPHDWSIELPRSPDNVSGVAGGFFPMGRGWYRKPFQTETDWHGKVVTIEFEGVYMNAKVWLNQHLLGRHPYGYTSFHYDLTPYLNWDGLNVLKVFVDNSHQLNSRWYSGSGIYRPVWLTIAEPVHIAHWGVYVTTPQITHHNALVRIQTTVENHTDTSQVVTLRTRIIDPDGSEVGYCQSHNLIDTRTQHEFSQGAQVPEPRLWSPDTPHLYSLETEVLVGGTVTDTGTTTFGIRSLEFSPEKGFLLNGEPVLLKGGCVHHDNGLLGAASYSRSEERKVALHKASGFNAIRCAHNPPAPAFLDACNRLGMLVIDEAFDCWREGKNDGDYHVAFDDWWQRDLESMLYRDRNHPSIIMWSTGNEVLERDGRGGGVGISKMLADHVRAIDPSRPVTAAICGSWSGGTWEETDGAFATLDVGGYNYQWRQYLPDHERLPERIMMGTESFPIEAFENWMAVLEHPHVIGDFVWTSLDYLGESGIGRVHFDGEKASFLGDYPWHQANCGDLDLCGFKRPQSYYRDVLWHDDPCIYIAVHSPLPEGATATITRWGWPEVWPNWNWPGQEGRTFLIDVYANCEQVEILLNGRSLGVKPCTRNEKFTASFEVPYEPGELKAIGYREQQPVAETKLKTAGSPARIQLVPDRELIQTGGDLCYVTVEVVDAIGQLHPAADTEINFTIEGAGRILGVGNSNPVSEAPYVGNRRKVFRGRGLVVVKSSQESGEICLSAQADGLEGAEIKITSTGHQE